MREIDQRLVFIRTANNINAFKRREYHYFDPPFLIEIQGVSLLTSLFKVQLFYVSGVTLSPLILLIGMDKKYMLNSFFFWVKQK